LEEGVRGRRRRRRRRKRRIIFLTFNILKLAFNLTGARGSVVG
jgi:hypothetical protein